MATNDPFLTVQTDVLALLDTTRPLFQSYLRIRTSASSPSNPELRDARAELATNVEDLKTDLQDLVASVRAVEGDPYKYGLEVEEVQRRREFVKDVGKELFHMHSELQDVVHSAQARRGSTARGLPDPDSFGAVDRDQDEDDGVYAEFEQQRQMEIMAEQDEALEGVFKTVGNLRAQADSMGREMAEQAEMLDDVETITDRVGGKVAAGMTSIKRVIERNEGMISLRSRASLTDPSRRHLFVLLHHAADFRPDSTSGPRTHIVARSTCALRPPSQRPSTPVHTTAAK